MAGLAGVLCAAMLLPIVAASGILVRNTADKVTSTSLGATTLPQRSAIFDRDGHLITYVYGVDQGRGSKYEGVNRQPVPYDRISPYMLQAIVSIEDDRYWQHGAIDLIGTLRAVIKDLQHNAVQGGSSIEQQYVKGVLVLSANGDPAAQQAAIAGNLSRKYTELRMALDVAHRMSKQDILDGYLNDAYFDHGAWGIEAAAETYFHTRASNLNLIEAATLAGIVEDPSRYDPINNPVDSLARRNTVLRRMMETQVLSPAVEATAIAQPLRIQPGQVMSGCSAPTVGNYGYFCDYVIHTLLLDKAFGATAQDRAKLLATGGLQIHTTVSQTDEDAATYAVNYVLPHHSKTYNPAGNAATTAMVSPGSGEIMAIAENRAYGTGPGQTEVDYAVPSQYGGAGGVQTGSSSKFFTLVTALEQGIPFGFQATVPGSTTISGYTDCAGDPAGYANGVSGVFPVSNSEGPGTTTDSLVTGTTKSINVFFAALEQKVGLCNVVKTAASLGMTRADGRSLFDPDGAYRQHGKTLYSQPPADQLPAFTLGVVNVAPLQMAAAYATAASGGIYCAPVAITAVTDGDGESLKVPSANCHRALSSDVANAVSYILRGVLTNGTASNIGPLNGYDSAGKTGTSNVENGQGTPYAAFAGYTTNLASFTSVFNPISPTGHTMTGESACYRPFYGGLNCPGEMFGADAPANIWKVAFEHANLGHSRPFGQVSPTSALWSKGDGKTVTLPTCPTTTNNGGPTPSPSPTSNGPCTPGKKKPGQGGGNGNGGGKGGPGGPGGGGGTGGGGGGGGGGPTPTGPPTLPPKP
jgi:membrane peptidoglycan carboxypeptidase